MNNFDIDENKINFDVYNGLNLYSPYLGETYAKFKWNPLGDNFKLDISFIERYLDNAKEIENDKMPAFIESEPKKVLESFRLATKRNKEMLNELQSKFDNHEFADFNGMNIEKQVEEILFILKCRQKMFEISIKQIKSKTVDAFKAYKNISGLNKKLSQLLEELYQEEYNKKIAIQNMLLFAEERAKDFSNKYDFKPFNFDETLMNKKQNEHSFIEKLLRTVANEAKALNEKGQMMSFDSMPKIEDLDEIKVESKDVVKENNNFNTPTQDFKNQLDINKQRFKDRQAEDKQALQNNKDILPKRPQNNSSKSGFELTK